MFITNLMIDTWSLINSLLYVQFDLTLELTMKWIFNCNNNINLYLQSGTNVANSINDGSINTVQPRFIYFKYIYDDITTSNRSNNNNSYITIAY